MIKDDKISLYYYIYFYNCLDLTEEQKVSAKNRNTYKFKRISRVIAFMLCVSMLIPVLGFPTYAEVEIPTGSDLVKRIEYTYAWAKRYTGYSTFKNYCAHYVNTQLLLLGINTRYVGGNGNDEYDNYKDLSYTGGGRKVHNYPATNATFKETLERIAAQGDVVTDVLVGFQWTSTTAGKKYGHSFLIHGIIDGYVYFSDSFNLTLGGKYYKEGSAIKCTIDQLVAYYGRTSAYTLEGLIWFEDEELTAAMGGGNEVDVPSDPSSTLGIYEITYYAGMKLRSGPGTGYSTLDVMPTGTQMYVTEIKDGWGYTSYNGKAGWCCLPTYTKKVADLPSLLLEKYEGSKLISREAKSSLADALSTAKDTARYSYNILALGDIKLTADTKLGAGITLSLMSFAFDSGSHSFELSGGIVRSSVPVTALKNSGLVSETVSGGEYIYTSYTADLQFSSVSLLLSYNVALRFTARFDVISSLKNASVLMIATDAAGNVSEYKPDSAKDGIYVFTTDSIPSRKWGDDLKVQICIRSTSLGAVGELRSGALSYSPVDYVRASYGSGEVFDNLLSAMLNYGTEAQEYFKYNSSSPVNSVLPEDKRGISGDNTALIKANPAPIVGCDSTVHVTSAQLVLLDNVALRLHTEGDPGSSDLSLLVWTDADYRALKAKADAAGKDISSYLVKGNETYLLADEEGSFTLDDISTKQCADTYYFRLCQTDGKNVKYDYVFSYSITEYCAYKLSDGVEEDIDPLCRAIANYSAAVREYFGYEVNG